MTPFGETVKVADLKNKLYNVYLIDLVQKKAVPIKVDFSFENIDESKTPYIHIDCDTGSLVPSNSPHYYTSTANPASITRAITFPYILTGDELKLKKYKSISIKNNVKLSSINLPILVSEMSEISRLTTDSPNWFIASTDSNQTMEYS